ncbi:guanylate kinase [Aurantiacibacter suaedae]|uniref:guanylate kinase n=1 Tax=Aurantiacibacter suaedae TaxID=2545755 RepID=UPI0010F4AD78|nr:guanylate kinase [Aurantiacibacter suaedae]
MAESKTLPRRGLMFILSSPSGAGKTTIARKLLAAEQSLAMSVSVTTRPMRPGETEGQDYFFTQRSEFDRMVEAGEFLEWAEVFGNCYGTPRAQIAGGLAAGQDYLFDIDWQGAQQLSQAAGPDVVSVFLLPPSIAELEHRLRSRGTDSDEVIRGRMDRARAEISHWDAYDYVLVNSDVEACFEEVGAILHAERLKRERQRGLIEFARELMR